MLWRHGIVIGSVAALFMMLTGLYVASQKPLYTSEGVTDDYDSRPRGGVDPRRYCDHSERDGRAAIAYARDVASTLHLDADPEFNPLLRPRDNSLLSWLDPLPFLHRLITPSRGSSTPVKKRREQYQAVILASKRFRRKPERGLQPACLRRADHHRYRPVCERSAAVDPVAHGWRAPSRPAGITRSVRP